MKEHKLRGKHTTCLAEACQPQTPYLFPSLTGRQEDSCAAISRQPRLYVWSTSDEHGFKRLLTAYQDHFRLSCQTQMDPQYMSDLAYTLSEKRTHLPWRFYTIADSFDQLKSKLTVAPPKAIRSRENARLIYIFTGQGAQWHAMARELFSYPVFDHSIRVAGRLLGSLGCSWCLKGEPEQ